MGTFRSFKDMINVARSDELKDMRQMAAAQPKTSMMDAMRQGTAAMGQATEMQGIAATGVAGQATIHSTAMTGTMIGHTPVVAFDVTVELPGRPGYRVEHSQMLSPLLMAQYTPGATVPVRVSVDDPSSIVLGAA